MNRIELKLDDKGLGQFYIRYTGKTVAWMDVRVTRNTLTVYHTEVLSEFEGRHLAKDLMAYMLHYAKENKLKLVSRCQFVDGQLSHHPEEYGQVA